MASGQRTKKWLVHHEEDRDGVVFYGEEMMMFSQSRDNIVKLLRPSSVCKAYTAKRGEYAPLFLSETEETDKIVGCANLGLGILA